MVITEQILKGDDYNVYMKIPTYLLNDLHIENGDWLKLRVGTGYFALVKANEKRNIKIKDNTVRFPQRFCHTYRFRANDKVQMFSTGDKIIFRKIK
jgi:antitoxin component of MazEF toxin-antitoxin module